jgi:hypothetical protein
MRKLTIAAALAALLGTSAAHAAGGIQLNLDNPGSIGGSTFFSSFDSGPPYGTALLDDAFAAGSVYNVDGSIPDPLGADVRLIYQSMAGPITQGANTGYLTYQFVLPVTTTKNGTNTVKVANSGILVGDAMVVGSEFYLYFTPSTLLTSGNWDSGALFGNQNFGGGLDTALLTGQKLLASGKLRITVPNGAFNVAQDLSESTVRLSPENKPTVGTITTNPTQSFQIDFDTLYGPGQGPNTGVDIGKTFVINPLTAASIDVNLPSPSGKAPYQPSSITGNSIFSRSPTKVAGVTPYYGEPDLSWGGGINDFVCGSLGTKCDFEFQVSSNMTFVAGRVPEPASLALAGLGLLGVGCAARKRRTKAQA